MLSQCYVNFYRRRHPFHEDSNPFPETLSNNYSSVFRSVSKPVLLY